MIQPDHELSIKRQAELLGIARGSAYYVPRPVSDAAQALMRRIDALHLEHPFAGARMLRELLRREGVEVGRMRLPPNFGVHSSARENPGTGAEK